MTAEDRRSDPRQIQMFSVDKGTDFLDSRVSLGTGGRESGKVHSITSCFFVISSTSGKVIHGCTCFSPSRIWLDYGVQFPEADERFDSRAVFVQCKGNAERFYTELFTLADQEEETWQDSEDDFLDADEEESDEPSGSPRQTTLPSLP